MFLKYVAVTTIICALMLGYLRMSVESEAVTEGGLDIYYPERTQALSTGDATFTVNITNTEIEPQDLTFHLKKNLPAGWEANFCFNDLCFYNNATRTIEGGESLDVVIGVMPDFDQHEEGTVTFSIQDENDSYQKEFYVTADVEEKEYRYTVTGEKEKEVGASKTAKFSLDIKNMGEEDTYSFSTEKNLPEAWKVSLSDESLSLAQNESKTLDVFVTTSYNGDGGEEGTVSLRIIPQHGEEKRITLTAQIKKEHNFTLRCAEPKKYTPKGYDVTFNVQITNTGNAEDTYSIETEEGILSEQEIQLSSGDQSSVTVTVPEVHSDAQFSLSVNSESGLEKEIELQIVTGGTQKKVFAEMFTATWCQYCPEAEAAIEEISQEYGEEVFCIQYHPGDFMETTISEKRLDHYGFEGYPTVYFNGNNKVIGGYTGVAAKYREKIDEELQKDDNAIIDLNYENNELTIKITPLQPSSEKYTLYIVTYKDMEHKTQQYPNVAQDHITREITLESEKILKERIDIEEGVVVFIQDEVVIDFEVLELV